MKYFALLGLCFFFVSSFCASPHANYTLYKFTASESNHWGARCLDGTPSGFFYLNGTNINKTKWVLFLEGGGLCIPNATHYNYSKDQADDCYERAKSPLGSSHNFTYPNFYVPSFASSWNIIYVPYCGGDYHSGTNNHSVGGLFYAGHLTVNAVVQKLKQIGLNRATDVLFSGGSAGAVGVFANLDFIKAQLPTTTNLMAFPNAGWGIDFPLYTGPYQSTPRQSPRQVPPPPPTPVSIMYSFANSYLNVKCVHDNPSYPYVCFAAEIVWPYINQTRVPFFIANSMFDTVQLVAHVQNYRKYNFSNPTENEYIVKFGAALRNSTATTILPNNGLFITSQGTHVITPANSIKIGSQSITLQTAINNWFSRTGNYQVVDPCTTPNCQQIPLPH
eukprot:Phypoly_transcript_06880.p1 GENE.Phypoly_transcript_06880~~Phypoly_transcript_06880.p1  ORF type:complete len:390 (+),score=50.24 Phypoly_transcript_06880:338-1507(+)